MSKGSLMFFGQGAKRRGGVWILEGMDQILGGGGGGVGRRGARKRHLGWKPDEGVCNALAVGFEDPDLVAAVVFGGWTGVETEDGVRRPSAALVGQLVDKDSGSRGAERGAVEIGGP